MFEHKLHEPHPTIVYPRIPVIFIMHGNNASKKSGASTFREEAGNNNLQIQTCISLQNNISNIPVKLENNHRIDY